MNRLALLLGAVAGAALPAVARRLAHHHLRGSDAHRAGTEPRRCGRPQNSAATADVAVSEARMQFVPGPALQHFRLAELRAQLRRERGTHHRPVLALGEPRAFNSGVTLFNGFANTATLRQAKLESHASELDLDARPRDGGVHGGVQLSGAHPATGAVARAAREPRRGVRRWPSRSQTYVNAGSRTVADLYQQQANVASAQLTLVEAERAAELARVELMDTLHLDRTAASTNSSGRPMRSSPRPTICRRSTTW